MTDFTSQATIETTILSSESPVRENFKKTELVPCCIIIVIGFLANLTVLLSGTRKGVRSKHYSNYFILTLAFADLGVVMMAIPINIVEYTSGLNVSQFTCAFIIPIRETFQCAALQSVAVLALARLKHITSHSNRPITNRLSLIIVTAIWLNSYLLISLPFGFVYKIHPDGMCNPEWSNLIVKKVHITLTTTMLYLPMVIATISYVTIIKKLQNLRQPTSEPERVTRKSRNLSILLTMLMITCWISSFPLGVLTMLNLYDFVDIPLTWLSACSVLFYSSSAINPVLVLLMKRDYRVSLPKLPRRKCRIATLKNEQEMVIQNPKVAVHK